MESIKTTCFEKLKKSGLRLYPARWILFIALASNKPRLGITIPKALAGSVLRNKLKRWARECFRRFENLPKADINLVLKKGKNYKELTYNEFKSVLEKGFRATSKRLQKP